jgi:hypothetical protein
MQNLGLRQNQEQLLQVVSKLEDSLEEADATIQRASDCPAEVREAVATSLSIARAATSMGASSRKNSDADAALSETADGLLADVFVVEGDPQMVEIRRLQQDRQVLLLELGAYVRNFRALETKLQAADAALTVDPESTAGLRSLREALVVVEAVAAEGSVGAQAVEAVASGLASDVVDGSNAQDSTEVRRLKEDRRALLGELGRQFAAIGELEHALGSARSTLKADPSFSPEAMTSLGAAILIVEELQESKESIHSSTPLIKLIGETAADTGAERTPSQREVDRLQQDRDALLIDLGRNVQRVGEL